MRSPQLHRPNNRNICDAEWIKMSPIQPVQSVTPQCAVLAFAAMLPAPAIAADDGWQARVGEALGKTGSSVPGGIYRVGLPRTDLKVTLDGIELKPGFALGSWLAFETMGDSGMVMGDLVLTMDE